MENIPFADRFYIRPVSGKHVERFVVRNHYAQRMPITNINIFGLFKYESKDMIGVMIFSLPNGCAPLQRNCPHKIIELTRIALKQNEKNLVSWWMMQCISMLEKPILLVSYADANQHHIGYVYQATNWIYTGNSASTPIWIVNDKMIHDRTKNDRGLNCSNSKVEKHITIPKHRYFYPLGTKKQRKEMTEYIKNRFGIFPYPKAEHDTTRYDMEEERKKKQQLEGIKGFGL